MMSNIVHLDTVAPDWSSVTPAPHDDEPSFGDPQVAVEATASALWMHGRDLAVMAIEPHTRPHFTAKVRDDMRSTILRLQLILSSLKS